MEDLKKTLTDPLTYTIAENEGSFNNTKLNLNISLPTNDFDVYAGYDISKEVDGEYKNAVMLFIKSEASRVRKLPQTTSGKQYIEFDRNLLIQYNPNCKLDNTKETCLVIIFHEYDPTAQSIINDVTEHYSKLKDSLSLVQNGPYSNNFDKSDEKIEKGIPEWIYTNPRKLGMSLIKKSINV
ncbi:hypothetical protein ABS768_08375 [Flavobacterium sp. ST-75]|uniref:Uncharacterized protein n=1 Tax=Flavobacterium rhizophilum TaxID=3163296 RepID=A0ABW8YBB1_9FLAO